MRGRLLVRLPAFCPAPGAYRPRSRSPYSAFMAVQAVTVNLPDPLYQRLARRANRTHRTVEDETFVQHAVASLL
jgi:hypothetical protein